MHTIEGWPGRGFVSHAGEATELCTNVLQSCSGVLQFSVLSFPNLRLLKLRGPAMSALTETLTTRQAAVFEFIKDRIQSKGYGPTVREIGEHFQISSPNGVMCHLRALEKKQLLKRVRKHDRAIARAMELAPEIMAEEKGMPLA